MTFRIFRFLIIVLSYVVFIFIHCSSLVARVMACHSKKRMNQNDPLDKKLCQKLSSKKLLTTFDCHCTFIDFPVQINSWYGLFGRLIDWVFGRATSGDNAEEITQAEINEGVYTSVNCVNLSFSCYFCELCVYSAVLFLEDLNPLKQPFPTEVSNITDSKDFDKQLVTENVPKIEIKSANSAPWIDDEVLKAVRKKERLRKRAKKSSSEYHWALF